MKKILAFALCALMLVSMLALVGCGNDKKDDTETPETTKATKATEAPATTTTTKPTDNNDDNNDVTPVVSAKFGAAVYISGLAATSATEDKAGQGSADITGAAVLVDADGKIIACDLDTMQNKVSYDFEGKAIANAEFKTKREQGDAYNMVAYGGAKAEWYAQADAFEALIVGKTVAEIKALVAEGNKGNAEVIAAGCTIMINDFVSVIEKAVANAKTAVAADATVKVTMSTSQTCTDATEDKDGSNDVETYVFAAALKDGKVAAASSDCVQVKFGFDFFGESKFDASKAIASKREQGSNYGMVAYGGAAKEWFEQADAFDAACIGKTGSEIAGLQANDGKGIDTLKAAGCTIYVSGFVAAASKI